MRYTFNLGSGQKKSFTLEDGATNGATLGVNLFNADGTLLKLSDLTAAAQTSGTTTGGVSAHRLLTGLTDGDDHPQYLRKDTLTANGDMYVRISGSVQRFPIGANGKWLTVSGGLPAWGTLATVAVSGAYADLSGKPNYNAVTLLTENDETADFPDSRRLIAGSNVTLDVTTPGEMIVSASGGGGGGAASGAVLTDSTDQSIGIGTTVLTFNTAVTDTDSYYSGGHPSRLTVDADGLYLFGATVYTHGTGIGGLVFRKNGTDAIGAGFFTTVSDVNERMNASGAYYLSNGDYIELLVEYSATADAAVDSTSGAPLFWITRLGGSTPSAVTSITAGVGLNGGTITGTGTIDLADTAVAPGSYTAADITVDAQGRITAAADGGGGGSPLTTKGDLFGHSTVDVRIPVGSNGKVLTADSTATPGVSWQTPASGSANITPDTHPGSPDAMDDEFEAVSLDAKWTWVNQGGATALLDQGAVTLRAPATASRNARCIIQPLPAGTTWRFRAKVSATNIASGGVWGFMLREASSQHITAFGNYNSGGTQYMWIYVLTDPNTQAGYYYNLTTVNWQFPFALGNSSFPLYFEIERNGTTLTYRVSFSGLDGTFVDFYSNSITTDFTTAPDGIGFLCDTNNGGVDTLALADWFRRMA